MKKITLLIAFITISVYSQTQQLDQIIGQSLDLTDTWVDSFKMDFTYNSNHICTDEIAYEKNESNQWVQIQQIQYTLDANNRVTEILTVETGENPIKELLTYNSNNKIIERLYQNWNSSTNQFEDSYKHVNSYDSNTNLKIETIRFFWDGNLNTWKQELKSEIQYNSNNLIELMTLYEYNDAGNDWFSYGEEKYTFQYNTNNKLTNKTYFENDSGNWIALEIDNYTYDANSNVLEHTYLLWEDSLQNWMEDTKDEFNQYDNSFTLSDLILPYSLTNAPEDEESTLLWFNHKLLHIDSYYDNELVEKDNLIYTDITASTNDFLEEMVSIYPNPFNDYVTFNLKNSKINQIKITDIQGRTVYQNNFLSNEKINLNQLQEGAYFYTINNVLKGKLIKK